MEITGKTLQVSFEHNVSIGNGTIEAALQFQAWIFEGKDSKIYIDIDFTGVENVKFMGMPIENGYKGYDKFKKTMSELGIDINKRFDDEESKIITDEFKDSLREMYREALRVK